MQSPGPNVVNGDERDNLLGPDGQRRASIPSYGKDENWPLYNTSRPGAGVNGKETGGAGKKKKAPTTWTSLDVYQSLANVARHPSIAHEGYYDKRSCPSIFWRMMESIMVLAATGILTGFITLAANVAISFFQPMGMMIVGALQNYVWLACPALTVYVVVLSLCSVIVTNNICPEAVGGGIPDVKTVLSGLISRPILSVRLIFAKMLGLVFALVAGLSVGKEGPFVHVAVAVSDSLMRLRCFRHCRRNISKRLEILGCACAAGVAATFGTPFGGVLFSIEVTATCYMVRNLPRAFLTAVCASLVYNMVGLRDAFALFQDNNDKAKDYSPLDLLLSIVLGVGCGLTGAVFVALIQALCISRNRFLDFTLGRGVVMRRRVWLVGLSAALMSPFFYLDAVYGLQTGDLPLTDYLFTPNAIGPSLALILYIPFKFLITCVCVSLPLPVGLFTPTFATGGAIGRLFGELIAQIPALSRHCTFAPWEFAVIGAAAFASGVTRAISTAIIVFELSGQYHLHLPMSVAILCAYFIANRFTKNVYDVILDTNGVPILPELPAELYMVSAAQVMKPMEETPFLTLESTFGDAEEVVARAVDPLVPVVDSDKHMALQGAVLLEDLTNVVNRISRAMEDGSLQDLMRNAVPVLPAPEPSTPLADSTSQGNTPRIRKQVHWPASIPPPSRLPSSPASSPSVRRSPRPPRAPTNPRNLQLNFVVLKEKDLAVSLTPQKARARLGSSVDVIMDPSPYQIADSMILSKVDLCFRMLKLSQAYVVRSGRLVGVLTRDRLTEYLGGREKRPMDRCRQLTTACLEGLCCRSSYTPRSAGGYEPVLFHKWPSGEGDEHHSPVFGGPGAALSPPEVGMTINR